MNGYKKYMRVLPYPAGTKRYIFIQCAVFVRRGTSYLLIGDAIFVGSDVNWRFKRSKVGAENLSPFLNLI